MSLNTNIVAAWKFDESSGDAMDSSGNGWTLTNTNSVSYVAGKINNAADFGSSNSNKYFINNSSLGLGTYQSNTWTIRRPIYLTTLPTGTENQAHFGLIATSQAQINFGYANNSGSPRFEMVTFNGLTAETLTWSTTLSVNTWYDVMLVKNGTTVTLYLNGSSLGNQTITIANITPSRSAQFVIGKNAFDNSNYQKGYVDEATVWSDAKTSTDALTAYNGGNWLAYPFTETNTGLSFLFFN